MSTEQTRRVIEAIAECDAFINREMTKYSPANRNHTLVAQYEAHKAKLIGMLK